MPSISTNWRARSAYSGFFSEKRIYPTIFLMELSGAGDVSARTGETDNSVAAISMGEMVLFIGIVRDPIMDFFSESDFLTPFQSSCYVARNSVLPPPTGGRAVSN